MREVPVWSVLILLSPVFIAIHGLAIEKPINEVVQWGVVIGINLLVLWVIVSFFFNITKDNVSESAYKIVAGIIIIQTLVFLGLIGLHTALKFTEVLNVTP